MKDFNFYPNTELGIDLKLLTCRPGRIETGKVVNGTITRDGEDHFTFVQNQQPKRAKAEADPHLYRGACVTSSAEAPTFGSPSTGHASEMQTSSPCSADRRPKSSACSPAL